MFMCNTSKKEAGRLGGLIASKNFKERYNSNPKKCEKCNKIIPYNKRRNKFCGEICTSEHKISINKNRKSKSKICLSCNNEITSYGKKFCSITCQHNYYFEIRLNKLLNGENVPFKSDAIKKILIHQFGYKCFSCKNDKWLGKPITLELHHNDGNYKNNTLLNLSLLCPNCHSFTDNYKAKNKNSTRDYRKKYYSCKHCEKTLSRKNASKVCEDCMEKVNISKRKIHNRPSKIELAKLILEKPFLQIGKDYDVSDNAVRKWCKSYNLPYRKKDIEEQREQLEQMIENELILIE